MKRHLFILILVGILNAGFGQDFYQRLADSCFVLTKQKVDYDPSYFTIPYPNGDVPADKGVCTDVIIRAYRKVGIDLQKTVHEDMKANFGKYPKIWGLSKPDKNIDHRRVPNLMTYFTRQGSQLSISQNAEDYKPGVIVCWNLGRNITSAQVKCSKIVYFPSPSSDIIDTEVNVPVFRENHIEFRIVFLINCFS